MTPDEIERLVKATVRRELKQLLSPIVGDEEDNELVDVNRAADLLGYPSSKALYEDITAGLLRVGKEVVDRRRPGRKKPRYLFDIEACKARFKSNPSNRRAV
jgi:hypothetical protein